MKSYEEPSTSRKAFKGQPLIARLDGKSFHTFTKGLGRPFDVRLSGLMRDTMLELVDRFQAKVGYTQSDEITLCWHYPVDGTSEFPFDGRFQKLDSLLAAHATAFFNSRLASALPEKADRLPTFDCRSFVVPTLTEAYHAFLWRQQDCTKNAISMAAQSMFSHKSLQGLHGPEMQEKMWKEKGVNFNEYPTFFKRGVFGRRVKRVREPTTADFERVPPQFWDQLKAAGTIERTVLEAFDCWLAREDEPLKILFDNQEPKVFQ
jgi:tRNA(His) 5'-end guanylyltransferase